MAVDKRNAISVEEMVKVYRANMREPNERFYASSDMEKVVANHESLLLDIATKTPNSTAKFFEKAAAKAYSIKPHAAGLLGRQLHEALSFCRAKKKCMTTGKKLTTAVKAVAVALGAIVMENPAGDADAEANGADVAILSKRKSSSSMGDDGPTRRRMKSEAPQATMYPSRYDIMASYGVKPEDKVRSLQRNPTISSDNSVELVEPLADGGSDDDNGGTAANLPDKASSVGGRVGPAGDKCIAPKEYMAGRDWVRVHPGGAIEKAVVKPGPKGFALAYWPESNDPVETEMPNVLLDIEVATKPVKAKKAMKAMKAMKDRRRFRMRMKAKAAKDSDANEEEEEEEGVPPSPAPAPAAASTTPPPPEPKRTYLHMWYKNSHAYGIRQKFLDKKQIGCVSNKLKSQAFLELIADEAIRKLESGQGEIEVMMWAKSKAQAL